MAPNTNAVSFPLSIVDVLPFVDLKQQQQPAAATPENAMMTTADGRRVAVVTRHNMLRPLHCEAQQYAWGRLGSSSTVARMKDAQVLLQQDDDDDDDTDLFSIDETAPYAELWLGTHPSGMSRVTVPAEFVEHGEVVVEPGAAAAPTTTATAPHTTTCSLQTYVQANPEMHCGRTDQRDLSFLLKILSVRKVLSIQSHPDKTLAQQLHATRPDVYQDPNHKPEMAIALSEQVRAMCGFRPLTEICEHLRSYPEFRTMVGEDLAQQMEAAAAAPAATTVSTTRAAATTAQSSKRILSTMFQNYLLVKDEIMAFLVERMVSRLRTLQQHNEVEKLILQLQEQFPGDCGIFAPLLFNIITLNQGEGLYIGANEPHAYLSGEIIECMACSDNVVRAGLTPKLKDVDTLVHMLSYQCGMPDIYTGEQVDDYTIRYCPPVEDFCVEVITVPAGHVYELSAVCSPGILLTLDGDASLSQGNVCRWEVSFGAAVFVSAQTTCTIQAGPYGVRLVRACANVYWQPPPQPV